MLFSGIVGLKIYKAFNGQQAVEKVVEKEKSDLGGSFDLIFMDVNMPVMDGLQATKEIKTLIMNG